MFGVCFRKFIFYDNNYRSGVYIGFTCARNKFDNVFVSMFRCPMQSGLKSVEINQNRN